MKVTIDTKEDSVEDKLTWFVAFNAERGVVG